MDPSETVLPYPLRDLVATQGPRQERKQTENAQEPTEFCNRMLLTVPNLVHKANQEGRTQVDGGEKDRQIDHRGDVERLVDNRPDRYLDAERLPAELFHMARRGMERQPESLPEHQQPK